MVNGYVSPQVYLSQLTFNLTDRYWSGHSFRVKIIRRVSMLCIRREKCAERKGVFINESTWLYPLYLTANFELRVAQYTHRSCNGTTLFISRLRVRPAGPWCLGRLGRAPGPGVVPLHEQMGRNSVGVVRPNIYASIFQRARLHPSIS